MRSTAAAGAGSSSRSRSGATSSRPPGLNREVDKVFREKQVYRIDHYLGKETVRNLMVFRFGNGIFEPLWNRRYVDHVQITVAESIGVENRGEFYEETGASRDFLQNHLMQLLALVAMEPPAAFEAEALRDEKVKVLRAISPMTPERDPARRGARPVRPGLGGGRPRPGLSGRARGRPRVGDRDLRRRPVHDRRLALGRRAVLRPERQAPAQAGVRDRDPVQAGRPIASSATPTAEPEPNLLALRIQPDEGILLRFSAKVPGLGIDVRNVNMDFTYGSAFSVDLPEAYETLILDALLGDASLFTRADEVEEAWSIVTPILDAWLDMPAPAFPNYEAGSWGPDEADELMARDGRRWRRI